MRSHSLKPHFVSHNEGTRGTIAARLCHGMQTLARFNSSLHRTFCFSTRWKYHATETKLPYDIMHMHNVNEKPN